MEKLCRRLGVEVGYAFQELSDLPEGVELPEGRTNPGGPDRQCWPAGGSFRNLLR